MKTILITGSSRGIGRSTACALARCGYSIVVHGRRPSDDLHETVEQVRGYGVPVRYVTFDVGDRKVVRRVLSQDISNNGVYYGIVLNAGIVRDAAFPFMKDTDWDEVMSINLDGFFNVLKPLVEPLLLAKRGGRIIVVSSVAGILGNRGQVNYSASKAGLIGAVRALGLELAKKGVTVNCVAPGLVDTDMTAKAPLAHMLPAIPMRRVGKAEEISEAVCFLMSDGASYITRQTIAIDGGLS